MGDGKEMINILYEDNHLLCVEKPYNIPVQADDSNDEDLLTILKKYLKETYQKPGNVYLGLVHRLDRPVGGVMVFAKTSKAASRLSKSMQEDEVKKEYLAILDGVPDKKEDTLEDYLYKDTNTNTVSVSTKENGKYAKLDYDVIASKDNKTLVHILLHTGRSHQIRVQFSSRNLPLVYDQRYNPNTTKGQIALYAYQLTFPHPTTKEEICITSLPRIEKPWDIFEEYICQK